VKSDFSRLLRVLIDLIVDFRLIDWLVTTIASLLWVTAIGLNPLQAANDSGVENMPNSVQTLPVIEAGSLGLWDHLFSLQATLPRRAARALPLSEFRVDFKSFFHSFRVLDEADAKCFFAEDTEEKMRDINSSIKLLDTLVTSQER